MLYKAELTDEGYEVMTYGHTEMLMQTINSDCHKYVPMANAHPVNEYG